MARLVFMHVPKCAGTAFAKSLIEAVEARAVMWDGMDRTLFGDFPDLGDLPENLRRRILLGGRIPGAYDFVGGHMALTTLRTSFPTAPLVTLMREPRVRLLSHFLYCRALSDATLASWGRWAERISLARGRLNDVVTNPLLASQLDNVFARFLLHPHAGIPAGDFIPEERHRVLYREAVVRLDEFGHVDLLENPNLERNIGNWLGRNFRMIHDNVTAPAEKYPLDLSDEIDPQTLGRISRLSAIDLQLWIHVARRPAPLASRLLHRELGAGESEALALACRGHHELVLENTSGLACPVLQRC